MLKEDIEEFFELRGLRLIKFVEPVVPAFTIEAINDRTGDTCIFTFEEASIHSRDIMIELNRLIEENRVLL